MKTLVSCLLVLALCFTPQPCFAPPSPPPGPNFVTVVEAVLAITVVAVAATAVYVVVKCAKKLDRPPTIEKSTNRVDWSTSGEMVASPAGGWQFTETNSSPLMFYRARL